MPKTSRRPRTKEKWVGHCISDLKHLGNTSTNRVEGAHGETKKALRASSSLFLAFKDLDEFYNLKVL